MADQEERKSSVEQGGKGVEKEEEKQVYSEAQWERDKEERREFLENWERKIEKNESVAWKQYVENIQNAPSDMKQEGVNREQEWKQNIEEREREDWKEYLGNSKHTSMDMKKENLNIKEEWERGIKEGESANWKEYLDDYSNTPTDIKQESVNIKAEWERGIREGESANWKEYLDDYPNTPTDIKQESLDIKEEWERGIEEREAEEWKDYLDDSPNTLTDLKQEGLGIKADWERTIKEREGADWKDYLNDPKNEKIDIKQDGLKRKQDWKQNIKARERADWKQYLSDSPDTPIDIKKDGLKRNQEWIRNIKRREGGDWKKYINDSKGPKINRQNIKIKKSQETAVPIAKKKKPHVRRKRKEKKVVSNTLKRKHNNKRVRFSSIKNKMEQEAFKRERDNIALKAVHVGYRGVGKINRNLKSLKRLRGEDHKFRYLKKEWKKENRRKLKQKIEGKIFEEENDNVALKGTYLGYRSGKTAGRVIIKGVKKMGGGNKRKQAQKKQNQMKQAQKKQNQKRYAQAVRNKAVELKHFAERSLKAGAKKLLELLAMHKASLIALCLSALGGLLLYFFLIGIGINYVQMILTEVLVGTYQTDYGSMTDSDSIFKNMEARLEERINNIETEFPKYDEYRYKLGKIGHDSNLLLAYLGAKYQGFTPGMSEAELVEIFNIMYELDLTEEIEIRTRLVEKEDPITGAIKVVEEEYNYYILHITLTVKELKEILESRLSDDEKKQFDIYQSTGGGQNIYPNPLSFDWHSSITSQFGYRTHPISGDLKFHSGVDIAAPKGSPIYSSMEGIVIKSGENGGYGLSVEIENKYGERTRYAHCSKLLVKVGEKVKRRDKIAEVGSTGNSTGNHLHLEFIMADGTYLNPLFIVSNFNKEGEIKKNED